MLVPLLPYALFPLMWFGWLLFHRKGEPAPTFNEVREMYK